MHRTARACFLVVLLAGFLVGACQCARAQAPAAAVSASLGVNSYFGATEATLVCVTANNYEALTDDNLTVVAAAGSLSAFYTLISINTLPSGSLQSQVSALGYWYPTGSSTYTPCIAFAWFIVPKVGPARGCFLAYAYAAPHEVLLWQPFAPSRTANGVQILPGSLANVATRQTSAPHITPNNLRLPRPLTKKEKQNLGCKLDMARGVSSSKRLSTITEVISSLATPAGTGVLLGPNGTAGRLSGNLSAANVLAPAGVTTLAAPSGLLNLNLNVFGQSGFIGSTCYTELYSIQLGMPILAATGSGLFINKMHPHGIATEQTYLFLGSTLLDFEAFSESDGSRVFQSLNLAVGAGLIIE
jgi:hypothetical protein